jgi:hypothetical protein
MERGLKKPSGVGARLKSQELPSLTVPQWLAFGTFLVLVILAFLSDSTVTSDEFSDVKKLAIFLIAALLPSDVLIRYGRTQFAKANGKRSEDAGNRGGAGNGGDDDVGRTGGSNVTPTDMPRATLPQYLAFAAFVLTVILTLVNNTTITSDEFTQVNEVLRVLIVALLPSEATLRFSRALYLRDVPGVTQAQAKLI